MTKQPTPILSHPADGKDKKLKVPVPADKRDEAPQLTEPISFVYHSPDPAIPVTLIETVFNPARHLEGDQGLALACSRTESVEDEFILGPYRFLPQEDKHKLIADGHVLFASGLAEYGTEQNLDADIRSFILGYCDVAPFWVELMTAYCKMTWVYDLFGALPYLRFIGDSDSGKTRLADTVSHLCYKTVKCGGASSSASIFRLLERFAPTLYIDEADRKQSDLYSDIIKVLNTGYRRDGVVFRAEGENNDPKAFRTFGPKVLTTRGRFEDNALETRCLTLEVRQRIIREGIPYQLKDAFYEGARALRNKLLLWRFQNYATVETDESKLKLSGLGNRLTEITIPLMSVSPSPDFGKSLVSFCGKQQVAERADRPQALVLEAIRVLAEGLLKTDEKCEITIRKIGDQANVLLALQEPELGKTARVQVGDERAYYTGKRTAVQVHNLGFETEHKRDGNIAKITRARLLELEQIYPAIASVDGFAPRVGGRARLC